MHHYGGLSRLWRGYPHPAPDKRACRSSGGVCEVDSTNGVRRAAFQKLRKYDARYCIIFTEGYRSGHNEAVLKTVWAHAHVGSNPTPSARKRLRIGYNPESFSTKSTLSGGLNRIHDEIPHTWDEIRLDGGWVDLISSEALSEDFIQTCLDFILRSRI